MANLFAKCCIYFAIPLAISISLLLFFQTPTYSGEFVSNRRYNPVTIRRDEYGIPTIQSKTLVDTYYGLGHVHAQDRLWVVNFRRFLFSGRLSEVFGEETLPLDRFFRNLSLKRYCANAESQLDEETRALSQAYIDGFNDYVASLKVLPLEFWITWTKFEPLTLLDTALFGKTLSFFLAMDFQYEFIFDTLERLVGHEKALDILPITQDKFFFQDAVVMNDDDLKQSGIFEVFNEDHEYEPLNNIKDSPERRIPEPLANQQEPPEENVQKVRRVKKDSMGERLKEEIIAEKNRFVTGSNAWVVHGNHTTTGKPILANDPHLPNNMPSFWYEVALIYEGNHASGLSYPGFAGMSFGKTKYLSWGFTNLCADTTDIFDLRIKGDEYFYDGFWRPLRKFEEKLHIRGKPEPEVVTVYESHHGVVIDSFAIDIFLGMNFSPEIGKRYALSWIGYVMENTSLKPFNRMLSAKNAQEFTDLWKDSIEPSMSLLFATAEGDIGFIATGKLPIRRHVRDGPKPKDGTKKENDWIGYVPWEFQPKVVNPKKGYIVSANNKFGTDNIKYGITANMWFTTRAARINEMIKEFVDNGKKISVEDMKRMQLDVVDVIAREVCPSLIHFTELGLNKGYPVTLPRDKFEKMLDALRNWDYKTADNSAAASVFAVWHNKLIQKVFKKIGLEEQQREALVGNFKFEPFIYRKIIEWKENPNFNDYWCLNDENEKMESPCLYNIVKSLEEAWIYLAGAMGPHVEDWRWSRIHVMQYPQLPFSETPLKKLFHRTMPAGGHGRAVFAAGYRPEKGVEGLWEPNMRMVISMREGDTSYAIIDTGISENIMSKHYDDQMKLYHNNQWLKIVESVEGETKWENVREIKFKA